MLLFLSHLNIIDVLSILSGLDSASLYIETGGFAWLYVCVSFNLVTCVFYF